jgi:hypothetical protein
VGNHPLAAATVVDGYYPHHASLCRQQRIGAQVAYMIAMVSPNGADTTPACFLDRQLHGFVRQSVTKPPVTIDERSRGCFALTCETCTGDDQIICMGLQVARDLDDAM